MKTLANNWKAILALLLLIAAVLVIVLMYMPARREYEAQEANLRSEIDMYQQQIITKEQEIRENKKYESIQEQLETAQEDLQESRNALYARFPTEVKEEDQILYVHYLEQLFGNEIQFEFGRSETQWAAGDDPYLGSRENNLPYGYRVTAKNGGDLFATESYYSGFLSDNSHLGWRSITVNYTAVNYETFRALVDFLASDPQITSVRFAEIVYNKYNGTVSGSFTLIRYILQPAGYTADDYQAPEIPLDGEQGKDNIFYEEPNPVITD